MRKSRWRFFSCHSRVKALAMAAAPAGPEEVQACMVGGGPKVLEDQVLVSSEATAPKP